MLFESRFHEGIRSGAIAETVRAWRSPRVKPGGEYKLGASGRIRVDDVERLPLGAIEAVDAKRAGFESVEALRDVLQRTSRRRLTTRSPVYRVRFRYVGERADEPPSFSDEELRRRLERMGSWTRDVLRVIDESPGVSSAVLARELGRERARFKADVRKLKRLGLTRSLEIGYELTDAGRAARSL